MVKLRLCSLALVLLWGLSGCPVEMPGEDAFALDALSLDAGPTLPDATEVPDAYLEPDAVLTCDCDDGIVCTTDVCTGASCGHAYRHALCPEGQRCTPTGCSVGDTCLFSSDCVSDDPCLTARCEPTIDRCVFLLRDGDGDGFPSSACGGTDCADADAAVHPGRAESCDGIDSDCSGGPEPVDAFGCRMGESCEADGTCSCAPGLTDCVVPGTTSSLCVDTSTSTFACGACGTSCADPRMTCTSGVCACPAGMINCGGSCAFLASDLANCGRCGNVCFGGTCSGGSCGCGAGETLCPAVLGALTFNTCHNLNVSAQACGVCGLQCWGSSECEAGVCAFRSASVRHLYSANRDSGFPVSALSPDGHLFVYDAYLPEGYFEHNEAGPISATPLVAGPAVLVEHDSTGLFVRGWTDEANFVHRIAVSATRIWVLGAHSTRVVFAGRSFTPLGAGLTYTLVAIDRATGAVMLTRSWLATGRFPEGFAVDGAGVTLAGAMDATLDFGIGRVSSTGGGVVRLDTLGNVRAQWAAPVPSTRPALVITASDEVLVSGGARPGILHYSPTGALLHSFDEPHQFILPTADGVIVLADDPPFASSIARWVYTGATGRLVTRRRMTGSAQGLFLVGGEVLASVSAGLNRLDAQTLVPRASSRSAGWVWPTGPRRILVGTKETVATPPRVVFEAVDLGPI